MDAFSPGREFENRNMFPVMFFFSGAPDAELSNQVNRKLMQIKEAEGQIVEIRFGSHDVGVQTVSTQQTVVIIFAAVTDAMAKKLVDDQVDGS